MQLIETAAHAPRGGAPPPFELDRVGHLWLPARYREPKAYCGTAIGIGIGVCFGGGSTWTPPGFGTSMRLWLEGTGPFDLGSGGDVLRWHDRSGFANNAEQATVGNQPAPLGDRVRFVAANTDGLICDTLAAIFAGNDTPFTICFKLRRVSGNGTAAGAGSSASANQQFQMQVASTTGNSKYRYFRRHDAGGSGVDVFSNANVDTNVHNLIWIHNGTTADCLLDGAVDKDDAPSDQGALTLNRFTLGAQRLNAGLINPWDGELLRVLAYNTASLTAGQIAEISAH